MKKIIIMIVLLSFLVVGCSEKKEIVSGTEKIDVSTMEHKHCTRLGEGENLTTDLSYDVYYTGERLNLLVSKEAVTSEDASILQQYEDAYKSIFAHYEGLDYYDATVTREGNTVTSNIVINYDKIDIARLIEIEGEEDNIFENKEPNVEKWLELAKKFGTQCTVVTE